MSRARASSRALAPLAFAALVLALWQLACVLTGVRPATLPRPTQVAAAALDNRSLLASATSTTVVEIALGYLLAAAAGFAIAVGTHGSRTLRRAVYPWLVTSQMVPVPAIAPVIVLWTGFDIRPKLIVIALVSFFPVAVNTADGLRAVDPELIDLLRTLGASRRQRFRTATLPAALPYVFSGLKIAAALAVIGAVFAEWVGASNGLGYLVLTFGNETATAAMFATIAVLAVVGIALFLLVSALERLLVPWRFDSSRS